jgi:hypothetical protein
MSSEFASNLCHFVSLTDTWHLILLCSCNFHIAGNFIAVRTMDIAIEIWDLDMAGLKKHKG